MNKKVIEHYIDSRHTLCQPRHVRSLLIDLNNAFQADAVCDPMDHERRKMQSRFRQKLMLNLLFHPMRLILITDLAAAWSG